MPYCSTIFQRVSPEDLEAILSVFANENFVGGQAAYNLGNNSYSIDAGENDVRAIYDYENEVVRFFCRYEKEMPRYEKKLLAFARKYGIALK